MIEDNKKIMLPIEPISEWLVNKNLKNLSVITSVDTRYLGKIRDKKAWDNKNKTWREYKQVSTDMIEKIVLPAGSILRDIYPDF